MLLRIFSLLFLLVLLHSRNFGRRQRSHREVRDSGAAPVALNVVVWAELIAVPDAGCPSRKTVP